MKITAFCLFSKTWISLLSSLRRHLQLNQLPTLKGLRHECIPKLLVLNFAVFAIVENSRDLTSEIKYPYRKLKSQKKSKQLQYILKYRQIISWLTDKFHSLTVPSIVK